MIWNLLEVLDFLSGEIQIIWGFDLETSRKFAKLSGNLQLIWLRSGSFQSWSLGQHLPKKEN
jgi:hypothetical protein